MASFNNCNIAIIHDSFTHVGGAEQVLFQLVKLFPKADIYIPIIKKKYRSKLENKTKGKIYSSFFSNFSSFGKYISIFKPLILIYLKRLNLPKYDIVISSSHSFSSKSVKTNSQQLHISYIHTPPRYLYEEFNEFSFIKKFPLNWLLKPIIALLKKLDFQAAQNPDVLIANSKTTQQRIKKYYKKDSVVIYPPVKTAHKKIKLNKQNHYLFFSRIVKQKGCRLAIKTFNKLNKKLVVVGDGSDKKNCQKSAKNNIKFAGYLKQHQLEKILSNTKALIYCSIEEDFGMIPVEIMSYGIPVIAYNSGGIKETVIDKKTGIFFDGYSSRSLSSAIKKFEKNKIKSNDCVKQSQKFSEKIFTKKMLQTIKKHLKTKNIKA
jgi:glycosyltransferase involved in cell wall biosynthesis